VAIETGRTDNPAALLETADAAMYRLKP
jgi:hypothetical protein